MKKPPRMSRSNEKRRGIITHVCVRAWNAILGLPKSCLRAARNSGFIKPKEPQGTFRVLNVVQTFSPPPLRIRALTDPETGSEDEFVRGVPDGDDTDVPKRQQQTQSLLFSLPAEIRREIWNYVLGGNMFHITLELTSIVDLTRRARLLYWFCPHRAANIGVWREALPDCCNGMAVGEEMTDVSQNASIRRLFSRKDLLNLPLSCRRIYDESIDTLYRENTFDFGGIKSFYCFLMTVHAHRIGTISKARLIYTVEDALELESPEYRMFSKPQFGVHTEKAHSVVWSHIAHRMHSLRTLYVDIVDTGYTHYYTHRHSLPSDYEGLREGHMAQEAWQPLFSPQHISDFVLTLRDHTITNIYKEHELEIFKPPNAPFTVRAYKALTPGGSYRPREPGSTITRRIYHKRPFFF